MNNLLSLLRIDASPYIVNRTPAPIQRNKSRQQSSLSWKRRRSAWRCLWANLDAFYAFVSWLTAKAIPMHIKSIASVRTSKQLSLRLSGVKYPHHVQRTSTSIQERQNFVSGLRKATPYKNGINRPHFPNIGRQSGLIKLDWNLAFETMLYDLYVILSYFDISENTSN